MDGFMLPFPKQVGQASITVSLDDSPIEIKEVDVELNPDA